MKIFLTVNNKDISFTKKKGDLISFEELIQKCGIEIKNEDGKSLIEFLHLGENGVYDNGYECNSSEDVVIPLSYLFLEKDDKGNIISEKYMKTGKNVEFYLDVKEHNEEENILKNFISEENKEHLEDKRQDEHLEDKKQDKHLEDKKQDEHIEYNKQDKHLEGEKQDEHIEDNKQDEHIEDKNNSVNDTKEFFEDLDKIDEFNYRYGRILRLGDNPGEYNIPEINTTINVPKGLKFVNASLKVYPTTKYDEIIDEIDLSPDVLFTNPEIFWKSDIEDKLPFGLDDGSDVYGLSYGLIVLFEKIPEPIKEKKVSIWSKLSKSNSNKFNNFEGDFKKQLVTNAFGELVDPKDIKENKEFEDLINKSSELNKGQQDQNIFDSNKNKENDISENNDLDINKKKESQLNYKDDVISTNVIGEKAAKNFNWSSETKVYNQPLLKNNIIKNKENDYFEDEEISISKDDIDLDNINYDQDFDENKTKNKNKRKNKDKDKNKNKKGLFGGFSKKSLKNEEHDSDSLRSKKDSSKIKKFIFPLIVTFLIISGVIFGFVSYNKGISSVKPLEKEIVKTNKEISKYLNKKELTSDDATDLAVRTRPSSFL